MTVADVLDKSLAGRRISDEDASRRTVPQSHVMRRVTGGVEDLEHAFPELHAVAVADGPDAFGRNRFDASEVRTRVGLFLSAFIEVGRVFVGGKRRIGDANGSHGRLASRKIELRDRFHVRSVGH